MQVSRLRFLDATRGVALIAAILSHFGTVTLRLPGDNEARVALIRLGMLASPTFILVSGMLLGFMSATLSGAAFQRRQVMLVDRGIFLLLVAHPLICAALFRVEGTFRWSLSTDAIGVCFIAGALAIRRCSARQRLEVAIVGFLLSWGLALAWLPQSAWGHAVKEEVVGDLHLTFFPHGSFPIVPWFTFYLASTVLGERLARLLRGGRVRWAVLELSSLGLLAVGVGIALKYGGAALAGLVPEGSTRASLLELFRIGQKYPPGAAYLLFHAGAGLACVAAFLAMDARRWMAWPLARIAEWGETSLPIFVAHFYLYWLVLYPLGPFRPAVAWLYFLASAAVLTALSRAWRIGRCNRFLTVGWPHLVTCWQAGMIGAPADPPLAPAAGAGAHH